MNTYTGRCTYIFKYTGIVCLKSMYIYIQVYWYCMPEK